MAGMDRVIQENIQEHHPQDSGKHGFCTVFSISFDWEELNKNSDEILSLPEKMHRRKKINYNMPDEFQVSAGFEGYRELEKKNEIQWQRQNW
jgi:hypothetical protein